MVIGEHSGSPDRDPIPSQVRKERRRVADRRERERGAGRRGLLYRSVRSDPAGRLSLEREYGSSWEVISKERAKETYLLLTREFGPGDDKGVGSTQRSPWLPTKTPRKHAAQTERAGRVEDDEIELSLQSTVLKPVVENEEVDVDLGQKSLTHIVALAPLSVRNLREAPRQKPELVVSFAVTTVAPTQDGGLEAATQSCTSKLLDHRGLPGPPRCEIPNRDHRNRQGPRATHLSSPVPALPDGVQSFRRAQSEAQPT